MHLTTDHFKLGVSLETLLKCHVQFESIALLEHLLCFNYNLWL